MEFASNVLKELYSIFKEDVSLLIHHVSPMMKEMDYVLHVMLVMNLTEEVDVSQVKLQLLIQTAKHSKMEFVPNVQKEQSSILLEFVSQLILHAKHMMKEMDYVLHVILVSKYLLIENVCRVKLHKLILIVKNSKIKYVSNVLKDQE